jgi:hypothetical protein
MTTIPSETAEPAINRPEIEAQVRAAVLRYEAALTGNNLEVLDELFWSSSHTVRYGVTECLYGKDDIDKFRKSRPSKGLNRSIDRLEVTTFGENFAVANLEFRRADEPRVGRQSQTWVRMVEGWRIVSAHVSLITI